MITEPHWKSYIVETTKPIFTPKQCEMIIAAGRAEPKQTAAVGAGHEGLKKEELILKLEPHILVGYLLKKC